MPTSYNTAAPTPTTKNTINSVTLGTDSGFNIRDFLLNRNLAPVYPQIATGINGSPQIGQPVLDTSINHDANITPFGLPLETEGLLRYAIAIVPNKYKDDDTNAPTLITVENLPASVGVFGSVDFPQGQDAYPRTSNDDITNFGLLAKTQYAGFMKNQTLLNLYNDIDSQIDVSDWISLQPMGFSTQLLGYLTEYGAINDGLFGAVQASDILGDTLGSATLSAGLSLSLGGAAISFDFKASLSNRSIGASSAINDTKLGFIGSQQLALGLSNNADFNTPTDFTITTPTGGIVNAGSINVILGYNTPVSYLNDAGSIFTSEYSSGNIERANAMLLNTGQGQIGLLIANMGANLNGTGQYDNPASAPFRSGYAPGYKDPTGKELINANLYAFYNSDGQTIYNFVSPNNTNGVIPEISYNRVEMVKKYGFLAPEDTFTGPVGNSGYDNRRISNVGFTWTTSKGGMVNSTPLAAELPSTPIKSLLTKTQLLFNSKGMKNIISTSGEMNKKSSQIETANGGGISKGSAVLTAAHFNDQGFYMKDISGASETFCRTWTTLNRYDQVSKLVRSSGLTDTAQIVPYRFQFNNSTLEHGGFVKIAPYTTDKNDPTVSVVDPKNYMFSIENLAWNDVKQNLPPVEYGMGDLTTGKRGRIMWFPPYNIQFNETSNASWESTNFIGRGEPVYTYNNTERSGNLSFTIIVDHASYMNAFRNPNGPDDSYVASFFAGCVDPTSTFAKKLTVTELSSVAQTQPVTPQAATITSEPTPETLVVYFPNDVYTLGLIQAGYENGLQNTSPIGFTPPTDKIDYNTNPYGKGFGIAGYMGELTNTNVAYNDNYNYSLNGWDSGQYVVDGITYSGFNDSNYWTALTTFLTNKCPHCVVKIKGYASPQGNAASNLTLAQNRATTLYNYIRDNVFGGKTDRLKPITSEALTNSNCLATTGADTDTEGCKIDRKAAISFMFDPNLAQQAVAPAQPTQQNNSQTTSQVNSQIINRLYNEGAYFDKLADTNKFVFDRFRDKIKYFHPAFHSMTPEGLNTRLTFLHQCTRQGPTLNSIDADNLAFGRPPVCILRVGDFYNTKIVIDNINIDYEPIVWDLNPEGIGVQPMLANVNMSFKFIGGSTLMGPINKLQNALSFNYYANTHVYDPRADYLARNNAPLPPPQDPTIGYNGKPILEENLTVQYAIANDTINGNLASFITTNNPSNTAAPATTNQAGAAAQATGSNTANNPPTVPASNTTDESKITFRSITLAGNSINMFFDNIPPLSKDYDVSFVITIGNTTANLLTSQMSSDSDSAIYFVNLTVADSGDLTKGSSVATLVNGKTYQVTAKFGSFNKTNSFTYKT